MAAVIRAYREYWDEMLAVGLGVVLTDIAGNTVRSWIEPIMSGAGIDPRWLDPIAEALIGFGVLLVSEMFAPAGWKVYARLAAFGATAVAVANAVAILTGLTPAPAPAVKRVVPRQVTIRRVPAAPTVPARAPEIFGS
jgi:hypothetical protein